MADQALYYPLGDANEAGKGAHVDLNDVGECIAAVLADPDAHKNKTYTLLGEHQSGFQLSQQICMRSTVHCLRSNNRTSEYLGSVLNCFEAWLLCRVIVFDNMMRISKDRRIMANVPFKSPFS